ncbi:immunoglobulin-like domain-containing protein [Aquipuribacter hungaricus]|uniref:Immunoglobulin-like domain-containing protein n=1 Tax=Aquipuribacter hungaricus TaxID=545624 RepID=A0ABV7WL69_9MICO
MRTHLSRLTAAVAGVVTGALLLTTGAASAQTAVAPADLLLHYDFETAGVVRDVSGNGRDGVVRGTGATVAGGVLTLPGGASGSGAGYVEIPRGTFDGRDTLTISTWLRNETPSGNYAALFFGSATNPPSQYYILNPRNPAGRVKSVVTDGASTTAPWGTEAGISPTTASRGVEGPLTGTGWTLHTAVIQPGSITGYVDGQLVGTVPTTRTVSQFGTGLVSYIGRSSYPDVFYRGSVDDLVVAGRALSASEVAAEYWASPRSEAAAQAALAADAAALTVPAQTITDLRLPTAGARGSAVTWSSSDPARVAGDGTVTRPARGQADATVTLTATLALGGRSTTKAFTVTVLSEDPERDLRTAADAFELGITVVADDITLPTTTADGTADIAWTSEPAGVVAADGTVTRPAADTDVVLRARFTAAGAPGVTVDKEYRVRVLAAVGGYLASYITAGDTPRTDVLHLAHSVDGTSWTALNNGKGVLYPRFDTGSSKFGHPTLFRHPDGSFGMVATDDGASGRVFVYDGTDLITWTNPRFVLTNTQGIRVARADVGYDNVAQQYRLVLTATTGTTYLVTTPDLVTFSEPVVTDPVTRTVPTGLPAGALEASTIGVTAQEHAAVVAKLGRIVNTGVSDVEDVTVQPGESVGLPERVELSYSDGSTKELGVEWDTSGVDLATPGSYEVTGTVQQPVYGDEDGILVRERADPWVLRDDERTGSTEYYLTGSYPTTQQSPGVGYDRLVLRRAGSIDGLTTAQETVLLWAGNAAAPDTSNGSKISTQHFRYFWAPEFHRIGGDWYIFFTSGRSRTDVWGIRPAIIRCDGAGDPMDPGCWQELGYMQAAPGDTAAFTNFSLDMTYVEADGKHYVVWAEKPGTSDLRMAEIDPSNPRQLTSRSMLLSTPDFAWERSGGNVINEGAAVVMSEDEVFVFFSAASVDENYSIGVVRARRGSDLMDPASWTKLGYPLLTTDDFGGAQMGPGHNSFTLDEDGNPVIVYHARPPRAEWPAGADGGLNDPSRHARVKTVHFAADGLAVLNQTREEELAPRFRTVTTTVTVVGPEEPAGPELSVEAGTRCVAGKVVQTVRVGTTSDVPVTAAVTSSWGTRSMTVAADSATSLTVGTRAGAVPAGEVSVTGTADGASRTVVAAYAARSCG